MKSLCSASLWILVSLVGYTSHGAPVQSKTKITVPLPAESKDWGLLLTYRVRTDLQKSGERRDFTHMFASEFYYDLNSQWTVSTNTAVRWIAEGQNIPKEQDNPSWDDLTTSIGYSMKLSPDLKWETSVSNDFPTGNDSRNESIKNTATVSTGLTAMYFDKALVLSSNLEASKIFQSYDISTVGGESNIDNETAIMATIAYAIFEQTKISFMHSFKSIRQINGELQSKNTSTVSVSYKYKQAKIKLDHILGNYEKSDGYQLLFVDDTKRVVRLGVSFDI